MSRSSPRYRNVSVVVSGIRRIHRVAIPEMVDRRWVQRAPVSVDLRCATPTMAFHGQTLNVSRSGIAFERGGNLPFELGLTLVAKLTLPGDDAPVQVLAEVVRDWETPKGRCTAIALHPSARAASYPIAEYVARDR